MPETAIRHDKFITALQQEIAQGLTAVGSVINKLLPVQEQTENLRILGESCQLFANVHHSLSAHRRYKILPYLNPECKKVAGPLQFDEYLFGKTFSEALKNEQAAKKTSREIKKRKWNTAFPSATPSDNTQPGPSGTTRRPAYNPLNYQRPTYKTKMKEGRTPRQTQTVQNRSRRQQTQRTRTPYHRP